MRVQKRRARREQEDVVEDVEPAEQDTELLADMDALLDEIDDVLEENAETFVKAYVQKGGE